MERRLAGGQSKGAFSAAAACAARCNTTVRDEFRYAHELPLLAMPARHRLRLQAVRRHRAREVHDHQGRRTTLSINGAADNHDAFCKSCGSLLYSVVRDGAYVHVTYGTLAESPTMRPTAHIYVASKAPWFTITDDLPQHEEL